MSNAKCVICGRIHHPPEDRLERAQFFLERTEAIYDYLEKHGENLSPAEQAAAFDQASDYTVAGLASLHDDGVFDEDGREVLQ